MLIDTEQCKNKLKMKHIKLFENFTAVKEALNESKESDDVKKGIMKAINLVDESLSYTDLAKAVASVIKEEYGSHNIKPFMEVLHKELGI